MSDNDQEDEVIIIQESVAVPSQASAADTSNQDNKVSIDPSGQKYIRTGPEIDAI